MAQEVGDADQRIKKLTDDVSKEERKGVKLPRLCIQPGERPAGERFSYRREMKDPGHGYSDQRAHENVGRIVDSQINPWQANQKNGVQQGNPSENTGNEKKTGGKREEHNRMIAREGTPIVPVY